MYSLKQLQESFKRHLFTGDGDIVEHIVDMENASNDQRMATYSNAYYGRLVEALGEDFKALKGLLGEDDFTALCHDYIHVHPSTHYSLRWFGRHMQEFIKRNPFSKGREYLVELAELEWAFINTFDAADAMVLDENAAAAIPAEDWPEIKFSFHPSMFYFSYYWNILDIWKAVSNEDEIPDPQMLNNQSSCLIWRKELTTRYRILEADEAAVLSFAAEGANFAQLCERLAELGQDVEPDFNQIALRCAGLLKTWLAEGMIVELNT